MGALGLCTGGQEGASDPRVTRPSRRAAAAPLGPCSWRRWESHGAAQPQGAVKSGSEEHGATSTVSMISELVACWAKGRTLGDTDLCQRLGGNKMPEL